MGSLKGQIQEEWFLGVVAPQDLLHSARTDGTLEVFKVSVCMNLFNLIYTFMLTSLCRAEWSSCRLSPRQPCLRHAGQIHKLQPRHSSYRRSGLHCQLVCPGNSESHVLLVGSLVYRSPGAISPPCVWHIQLQPDALVGWECLEAGKGVDVVG